MTLPSTNILTEVNVGGLLGPDPVPIQLNSDGAKSKKLRLDNLITLLFTGDTITPKRTAVPSLGLKLQLLVS